MKRDRHEAFGNSHAAATAAAWELPVLHFKGLGEKDRFVAALNATSVGETALENFFEDIQEFRNLKLWHYEVYGAEEPKAFACVTCINGCEDMCNSAMFYNTMFKGQQLGMKTILSIDRSNRFARLNVIGAEPHREECAYPSNVSAVMRYMNLEAHDIPSVQNLKDACFQRIVVSENPIGLRLGMGNFAPGALQRMGQVALHFIFDPNNDFTMFSGGMPPQRAPEAPVETNAPAASLSDAWEEKLRPLSELVQGTGERDTCQSCCTFEKTILMEPCWHMYYCDECFRKMMNSTTLRKECPVCKQKFTTIMRAFR